MLFFYLDINLRLSVQIVQSHVSVFTMEGVDSPLEVLSLAATMVQGSCLPPSYGELKTNIELLPYSIHLPASVVDTSKNHSNAQNGPL